MRAHVELLAALGVALSVGTGSAARTAESLDGEWEFSFNRRIAFAAEDCEILAVGNSDPRGYDSFKDTASHPLRFGRAAVYLRLRAGVPARLTASAEGLRPATVTFDGK